MSALETIVYLNTPNDGRYELTGILDYKTTTNTAGEVLRSVLVEYAGAPDQMWVNLAALSYQQFRHVDCEHCQGAGVLVTRHPAWGRISCVDPELEEPCGHCGESGLVRIPAGPASPVTIAA